MSLLNWIKTSYKAEGGDQEIKEEGLCPNCWGSQEYGGRFLQAVKDKQIDINNGNAANAFIQNFVKTYLQPIKLQNHDIYDQCPVCKVKYAKS